MAELAGKKMCDFMKNLGCIGKVPALFENVYCL